MSGPILEIESVECRFDRVAAVRDVSLEIEQGEFLTLLGPSGSGKTTTLNMVAGLTHPSAGQIRLRGAPIDQLPPHRRNIGIVFQDYALFPHMTVFQNIAFPLKQRGVGRAEIERKVEESLELVAMRPYRDRRPGELSGGQRQRVALARATIFGPELLLMDEPLGALDRQLREVMQVEIRRLHQELGITVVYVTHDQAEAFALSDRIAVFNDGRVEQCDTPETLYESPGTLFVARFLGESNVFTGPVCEGGGSRWLNLGQQRLEFDSAPAVGVGSQGALVVRPEAMRIVDPSDSGAAGNRLTATVTDVRYFGSERRVWLSAADGVGVLAKLDVGDRRSLHPGDEVVVAWAPSAGVVVPVEERTQDVHDQEAG